MSLIAKMPILYNGKQYSVGETLPTDNELMVKLWIEANSAKEENKEKETKEELKGESLKASKAKAVTAQAGLAGNAINSETEENLVGRVPKTVSRTKGNK